MEIHWSHVRDLRPGEREAIDERLESLAAEEGDILHAYVSAKETGHHRHGGDEVTIRCSVRGGKELVATRTGSDVSVILYDALDALEREVRRLRDRRRSERSERPPEPPVLGIVDRVLHVDGYGFILTDAGESVYFHRNAVQSPLSFHALEEGDRVGLNIEPGEKGPQANAVVPAPPDAPTP